MAYTSKLSDFISKVGQGVKPNMFLVDIVFPQGSIGAGGAGTGAVAQTEKELVNLMCKSAALPASNLGVIEVPFRGRTVKIAGDRTFDTWSPTFINDKDFKVRAIMEQWSEAINGNAGNTADLLTPLAGDANGYSAHLLVHQLEKAATPDANGIGGNILRTYKLWYAFPTNISQIDLAYDSNDQIEEFSVEFQYSYWTTEAATNARTGVTNRQVNADV
jgi:hypothetical protein